jgi:hypothetical protein
MRLQYALTMNDPKSPDAAAMQSVSSTATSGLTRTDVLTALGYLQRKEGTGLALMYARYTKDSGEFKRAVAKTATEAQRLAIKAMGKGKDRKSAIIAQSLARLAVLEYCRTADTPGAKCRCGGSGRIADAALIARAADLVKPKLDELTKPCDRCRGTGLRPVPASRVYRAVISLAPDLAERTFYRHWRPLYDELLTWCYSQEERAERGYVRLTRREAA